MCQSIHYLFDKAKLPAYHNAAHFHFLASAFLSCPSMSSISLDSCITKHRWYVIRIVALVSSKHTESLFLLHLSLLTFSCNCFSCNFCCKSGFSRSSLDRSFLPNNISEGDKPVVVWGVMRYWNNSLTIRS